MDLEITLFHHVLPSLLLIESKVLHHWKQQKGKDHLKTLMCLLCICGGAAVGNMNEALKDKTHPCSSRSPHVTPISTSGGMPVKRALEEMVTSGPADSR